MLRAHLALLLALAAGCVPGAGQSQATTAARPPAPIDAAPIRLGELVQRRTFSGTIEAAREFTVAPKVGGRLEALVVDIGDEVEPGAIVARIDDSELVQVAAQQAAEVAVARANKAEAESAHLLAERALRRVESLSQQGITSESELDNARVTELARRSRVDVTEAQVARAEAALEAAEIQLSYAQVSAEWSDGDGPSVVGDSAGRERLVSDGAARIVGRRFVDAGGFVSPGTPLLSIVALDPIVAVITVPERDYARLSIGLDATLTTDAYPGERFQGRVARLAPVFNRSTRQVRVELVAENAGHRLKPGMFVRATLELERVTDAVIVPFVALAERGERPGLFVLDAARERVAWTPVTVGVRDEDTVEVRGEGLRELAAAGRFVVTLGQELCDDGASVRIVSEDTSSAGAPR
ncbi:MAG: efflux RND transporter periplasmic adaptor subunit [Planctomycetota bacterium]